MLPETFKMLAEREDVYWWHRARRAMSVALLRRYGLAAGCKWLELGCGPGGNLSLLASFRPQLVVGADISPIALDFARTRASEALLVCADFNTKLPFADRSFDVVTIFHVLYHAWISDEVAVLREVRRILRPRGLVIITEPAFPMLTREMDAIQLVRRRYSLSEMTAFCRVADLQVTFGSYFTSFGFPMVLAMKAIRRITASWRGARSGLAPDMRPLHPFFNETMQRLAAAEGYLIGRGWQFPLGIGLVCIARGR